MIQAIDRLRSLTVRDVMSKQILAIHLDETMENVARLLLARHVSAAPVVNDLGRCVGVISATDFLARDCPGCGFADGSRWQVCAGERDEALRIEPLEDVAGSFMTAAVVSVRPETPILEAAQILADHHLHRLVVLDSRQNLVGVVSTMDIVAALLNALNEATNETVTRR